MLPACQIEKFRGIAGLGEKSPAEGPDMPTDPPALNKNPLGTPVVSRGEVSDRSSAPVLT
jgi:hypothetical protein